MSTWWGFMLSLVGVAGFLLAGRKVWWAWYVNIAAQALWVAYALVTDQPGFLLGAAVYTVVFVKNAHTWTREHFADPRPATVPDTVRTPAGDLANIQHSKPSGYICPRWTNHAGQFTRPCPAHPHKLPRAKRSLSEEW